MNAHTLFSEDYSSPLKSDYTELCKAHPILIDLVDEYLEQGETEFEVIIVNICTDHEDWYNTQKGEKPYSTELYFGISDLIKKHF